MLACLVTPWEASGRPVAAAPAGATRQGGEVTAPVVVQAEGEGSQGEDFKTSFQTTTGLIPPQVSSRRLFWRLRIISHSVLFRDSTYYIAM